MMSGGADQHCLVLSSRDLSVWCYACNSYVKHERLLPLLTRAEALKFGEPDNNERLANVRTVFNVALAVDGPLPEAVLGRLCEEQLAMQCVSVAAGATAESNTGSAPVLISTLLAGNSSASDNTSSNASSESVAVDPSHAGVDRGLVLLSLDPRDPPGGSGQEHLERLVQGALAARGGAGGSKVLAVHCDATAALAAATLLTAAATAAVDMACREGETGAGVVARLAAEHAPDLIVVTYVVGKDTVGDAGSVLTFVNVGAALVEGAIKPALLAAGLGGVGGGSSGSASASASVPACKVAVCVGVECDALDALGEESAAALVEAVARALLA